MLVYYYRINLKSKFKNTWEYFHQAAAVLGEIVRWREGSYLGFNGIYVGAQASLSPFKRTGIVVDLFTISVIGY